MPEQEDPGDLDTILRDVAMDDSVKEWFQHIGQDVDLASDVPDRLVFPLAKLRWLAGLIRSKRLDDLVNMHLRTSVSRNRQSRHEARDVMAARRAQPTIEKKEIL